MKLNPSEISNLIRSRIDNFEALTQARTEGTVVSVTDGIAILRPIAKGLGKRQVKGARFSTEGTIDTRGNFIRYIN